MCSRKENVPVSFNDVMAVSKDNQDVYDEIRKKFRNLIPFVGAGLTAPVYGTWPDVLEALGEYLTDGASRNEFASLLKRDYLEAAQFLEDKRTSLHLERNLIRHFSQEKLDSEWDAIKSGPIWLLPQLFCCPVFTTNFDIAIETVYWKRGFAYLHTVDPTTSPKVLMRLSHFMGSPCIFKLHGTVAGDLTDYDKLVFTRRQYERYYAENGEVRTALRKFVDSRSMLFLGCSLNMDKTVEVFTEAAAGGVTHYAIVESPEEVDPERIELNKRAGELADSGISAIFYEKKRHESVRVVLEQLYADVRPEIQLASNLSADAFGC